MNIQGMGNNNLVAQMMGNLMQGAMSMATGNPMGAMQSLMGMMQTFQSLAGGQQNTMLNPGNMINQQGGMFPQMPQMPGMGGMSPLPGSVGVNPGMFGMGNDNGLGGVGSALGQMKNLRNSMQGLMANKNMSPEDKQMAMMQLQQQMQTIQQLLQMMSNIMKNQHQTAMAVIGNLR